MGFCLKAGIMFSQYQQPHTAIVWDLILLTLYSLKQIHCIGGCLPVFIPWCYLPAPFPLILETQPPSPSHWFNTVLHCAHVEAIPLNELKAQQGEGKTCCGKEERIQPSGTKPYLASKKFKYTF